MCIRDRVNIWGFNLDVNPRQVRASIGIVPQAVSYTHLRAHETPEPRVLRSQVEKKNVVDVKNLKKTY